MSVEGNRKCPCCRAPVNAAGIVEASDLPETAQGKQYSPRQYPAQIHAAAASWASPTVVYAVTVPENAAGRNGQGRRGSSPHTTTALPPPYPTSAYGAPIVSAELSTVAITPLPPPTSVVHTNQGHWLIYYYDENEQERRCRTCALVLLITFFTILLVGCLVPIFVL